MNSKVRNHTIKIKYGRYTVRWMFTNDKVYVINRGSGMKELPTWLIVA